MANKRIIDLTAAGAFSLTDVLEIDTGALSLKITGQQLFNLVLLTFNNTDYAVGSQVLVVTQGFQILDHAGGNAILNVDGSGNVDFFGNVAFHTICTTDVAFSTNLLGPVLESRPSGNPFRIIVNDAGVLSTEAA